MKKTTIWGVLGLLLGLSVSKGAGAQCPAVTNIQPNSITATTAYLNYNGAAGPDYTRTLTPQGGPPTTVRLVPPAYAPQQLTGLLPGTTYTVSIVTNCTNGQDSAPATATFTTAPLPPANDDCANALPITADCTAPTSGTVQSATPSLPISANCTTNTDVAIDVWYRFVASGPAQVLQLTAQFDGYAQVRDGACATSTALQCVTFGGGVANPPTQINGLVTGRTYYLRVYPLNPNSYVNTPSAFTLCLNPGPAVPANDECANADNLFVLGTTCRSTTLGTVVGATASSVPAGGAGFPTGVNDVWYRFVATNPTQTLELEPVDHTDLLFAEVRQGRCGTATWYGQGNNTPAGSFSNYAPGIITAYNCTPGDVYFVRVFAASSSRTPVAVLAPHGSFTLCVKGILPCPMPYLLAAVPTSTTAQLSWQPAPNGSNAPYAYTLEYGPAGFVLGAGTRSVVIGTTQAVTGLRPGTSYCYYVRSDCGGSQGSTAFTGPFCFQTLATPIGCTPPTAVRADGIGTTSAQAQWSYTPATGPGITNNFDVEYGPQGFTPGTGTLQTGTYPGTSLYPLLPSTDYCFYVRRDCGDFVGPVCFRTAGPTTPPDLVVSTTQTLAGGSYRNVTITGTGTLALDDDLSVAGALVIQAGGRLQAGRLYSPTLPTRAATIIGAGSVEVQDGATLNVFSPQGLTLTGSTGTVQVRGPRTFSPGATYTYENDGTGRLLFTGPGLPATVRNLTVGALGYAMLQLSRPLAVREVLALTTAGGSLDTNGQALTLLSDATGTALVDNTGGRITGNVTVQRFINSTYQGVGYRHYSAPISTATVGSLATAGFAPVVNGAYNTSATPGTVMPYPTVYGYDEARLATSPATILSNFDKGWGSPATLADPLTPGRGYTVHLPASALVSVTGPLNQSVVGTVFSRGTGSEAGWALVGNPFPSPLDCATLTSGTGPADNLQGVGAAIYVFESTAPYVGQYRTAVAGVGGSPVIASGQGFFVRALPNQAASPYVLLLPNNRKTTFDGADNSFRRTAAETRPLLTLLLRDAAGHADPASLYFTPAATPGFDPTADARKLPNSTGLNLSSLSGAEDYAINALPLLGPAALVVPLAVNVPAPGPYELAAEQLLNFGPGTTLWLHDALLGIRTLLTPTTRYAFTLAGTAAPGRLAIEFRPAGALATANQVLDAQVQLFPNPASTGGAAGVTVCLPARPGSTATATLLNALGQLASTVRLTTEAGQASGRLPTSGLAAGVYVVRVQAGAEIVTKRLVLE